MAVMKVLVFLPFVLVAASCIYPEPYPPHRAPYRPGGPAYPYGRERESHQPPDSGSYNETGRYESVPGQNSPPPQENRPSAPRIDDDFEPGPSTPEPAPKPRTEHPTAEATETPGRVLSPFPPHNVIDVEGFKSGALAKDPSNGKIFRVP